MSADRLSEEDVARYWDDNARGWAVEVRQGHDVARELLNNPAFLAFIGDLAGRRVLDAGCGEGHNTRILARRGARMTGVDLSSKMIELAEEEERREPLGIRYVNTSYAELGMFAGASFDAVVSSMALMDGPHFDRAMAECFRVLRPGGTLSFSITHPCFSAPTAEWVRTGSGEPHYFAVDRYFDRVAWEDFITTRFRQPVIRRHRPLEDVIRPLLDRGFLLRDFREPSATAAQVQQSGRLGRLTRIPYFLFMQWLKPAPPS